MSLVVLLIQILHIIIIIGFLYGPFLKSLFSMLIYLLLLIGLISHWILNNNACLLSQLEAKYRNIPTSDSFIYRLLTPMFELNHSQFSYFIYLITFILFIIVLYKVIKSPEWNDMYAAFTMLKEKKRF